MGPKEIQLQKDYLTVMNCLETPPMEINFLNCNLNIYFLPDRPDVEGR